jgi:hypothetical protein
MTVIDVKVCVYVCIWVGVRVLVGQQGNTSVERKKKQYKEGCRHLSTQTHRIKRNESSLQGVFLSPLSLPFPQQLR